MKQLRFSIRLAPHCRRQTTAECLPESLIGHLRDECLNETLLTSLLQARAVLAALQRNYNGVRPRSAIGNQVPAGASSGGRQSRQAAR